MIVRTASTKNSCLERAQSAIRWVLIAAVSLAGGCGNAHQQLFVGDWRNVGQPEPPESRLQGEFVVTTRVPGSGLIVKPGDLVKARVLVTTAPANSSAAPQNGQSQIVWVWTGREPVATDPQTFGYLGVGRTRKAFIGRALHEQFTIRLAEGSERSTDEIPVRGIISDRLAMLQRAGIIGGYRASPAEWPVVKLTRDGLGEPSADIEILQICPATLLQRTGTLKQFGIIVTTGDAGYATTRAGILGWTAIDAQCPAPEGHVRFQAGPFYHSGGASDAHRLADWSSSYVALRPPEKYPEEWQLVPPDPRKVVNARLAPIRKEIAELESRQTQADLHCRVTKDCETAQETAQRQQELARLREEALTQSKAAECEIEKKCVK